IYTFLGITIGGIILAFSPTFLLFSIGCLLVAATSGIGNGLVFKLVPQYFSNQAGIANGFVSMMGGLGGFFPPLILASIYSITGQYSIGFMLLSQVALASLILPGRMSHRNKVSIVSKVDNSRRQGILVTDEHGKINDIDPRRPEITGYTEEEVRGESQNILQYGEQD